MATFFPAKNRSFLERQLMRFCLKGPLPTHIGFIMDGNRRYAEKNGIEKIIGHFRGLEKMIDVWSLLREMGITQATMFACSIDNLKRSPEEVDKLMGLLRKLVKLLLKLLLKETPQFVQANICVRFIGRIELFAPDIQASISQITLGTLECTGFTLTIALGYSAREEMTTALRDLMEAVKEGILQPEDINEGTFSRALYTMGRTEPEIIIRTSGEIRLSDFLLWQSGFSLVQFVNQYWPDYSIWSFLVQILNFQVQSRLLAQRKQQVKADLTRSDLEYCQQVWNQLKDGSSLNEFIDRRNQRIEQAIEWIQQKRFDILRNLLNGSAPDIIKCDKYRAKLNNGFTFIMSPSVYLASFARPSFSERLVIGLLKKGPMPQHIGYILDGNNRFARKHNMKLMKGQELGWIKGAQVLFWQQQMGIRHATFFGFLASHFTTRGQQIDHLNDMYSQQAAMLFEKIPQFEEAGVCIRFFGKLDYFPLDLQKTLERIVLRTAHNTAFYFNFTVAYSTGEELAKAMNDLRECVELGILQWTDINESTLTRTLDSLGLPDPDIILRTSGRTRLNDFLYWQNSFSYLFYPPELWPEFSIWSLFRGIFQYQAQSPSLSKGRQQVALAMQENDLTFCKQVNGTAKDQLSLEEFLEQREARVGKAIEYIQEKRLKVYRDLLQDS